MYLALEKPWHRAATVEAPVVQEAPATPEAPGKKGVKKRRPGRGGASGNGAGSGRGDELVNGDDIEETAPLIELTAADRRVSWRGPDLVLPPVKVDMGGDDSSRSLNDEEIRATVREQSRPIIDCMVTAATGTDLRATVTIRMLVDGKGQVTRHRVQAPQYLFEHGMPACVERAVQRLRFPATGAFTLVTTPFELG
jgi:hypothetical protein